jgi:hypothetical protein
MDADLPEVSALQRLGSRDEWSVPDLPAGIDPGMLQRLDTRGWVQARAIIMWNQQKYFGDPTPPAPDPMPWVSPLAAPGSIGDWDQIFTMHLRDPERGPPCQVRVSPIGRSDLDRQRWVAETTARSFRATGCQVYPGVILAIQDGVRALVPVEDTALGEGPARAISGISVWGAIDDYAVGLARVESSDPGKSVFLMSGEPGRPSVGNGRIDAWIARADALRRLRQGNVCTFGGAFPISPYQANAAAAEIGRVVRARTNELLKLAPASAPAVHSALAKIADEPEPTEESLTTAIQELLASIAEWEPKRVPSSPGDGEDDGLPDTSTAGAPLSPSAPTSITRRADILGIDPRTLKKEMRAGRYRFRRQSERLWIFCESDPRPARAIATPASKGGSIPRDAP